MRRHQVSIARLMLVIAFAAIGTLVARGLLSGDEAARATAYPFALIVPAAGLGADRALYGNPRLRPFWVGFVAAGLLTALSYWPGLPLVGRIGADRLWEGYVNGVSGLLWETPGMRFLYASRGWHFVAGSVMFFLPQAILGLVAGSLALGLGPRRPACPGQSTEPA
ncbi:hypothetical protein [Tautonia plasticadhaerens]|uniref:Uncharacterized protein n=1 Tax=Tautonia plasticadhaerens TaxID=2527974 RepID=A0A518GWL1_9BACT|nr:hypothetical protein [Tautonia plasticadhaerens]QDV32984.1 hypothetical protein ElP_08260 [Tautonia plasticadhaerens]